MLHFFVVVVFFWFFFDSFDESHELYDVGTVVIICATTEYIPKLEKRVKNE